MEQQKNSNWFLILGIVFIAFNLRGPITAVGPLVPQIQEDLLISSSVAGMLTTIPLLSFGAFSTLTSRISSRLGPGHTMTLGLLLLVAGVLLRSFAGVVGLFVGTALLGAGIAVGNVLVPSMVKLRFPAKVGLMTSIYTTCMAIFAGVGSGTSAPLANEVGLGWRNTLAIWLGLTLVTLVIWLPQAGHLSRAGSAASGANSGEKISRSPMAWWLALYMGSQSMLFYSMVAWMPTILLSKGIDGDTVSLFSLLYQWVSVPASFFLPILAARAKDQRPLTMGMTCFYLVGMVIFLVSKDPVILGIATCINALGAGAGISLSMCMISLRAENASQAARLSGMVQSLGYLLAACGPFIMGAIFDATASWTAALTFLLVDLLVMLFAASKAGANRHLFPHLQQTAPTPKP